VSFEFVLERANSITDKKDKNLVKVGIFNKSKSVSRFDIFKKFFECVNSKTSSTCCSKTGAVYQNVFDCERTMANLTIRLILCLNTHYKT